jgi:hypothetical protein
MARAPRTSLHGILKPLLPNEHQRRETPTLEILQRQERTRER